MEKTLRFLMLEDSESDALLVKRELKKNWNNLVYKRVYSADAMRKALYEEEWELVISDYSMPSFTGMDGLEILQNSGLDIPFIMVSGTMGEEIAVAVLKAGAQDYILKEKLHRLVPAIERELHEQKIRKEHKLTTKALDETVALSDAVIQGSPIGISVRNRYGKLLMHNKAWKVIWGYTDEQIEEQKKDRNELKFNFRDKYLGDHAEKVRRVYTDGIECQVPDIKLSQDIAKRADWVSQHFYALKQNGTVKRVVVLTEDISKRKNNESRQRLNSKILHVLNVTKNWKESVDKIINEIKNAIQYDAIAIRLQDGNDFPYFGQIGFSEEFVKSESSLLKADDDKLFCNINKIPNLDCLCGHVIKQDYDHSLPYFSDTGSFCCNDTDELVEFLTKNNSQLITRFTCINFGYKSLALIPLRTGDQITGLLQINHKEKNAFTKENIQFFEEISVTMGMAFQRLISEQKLKNSEEQFRSLYENSIMGIFRLSTDGRIMMMNPCLLDLLGYKNFEEFNADDKNPADDFRRITRKLFNNITLDKNNSIHKFEAGWTCRNGKNVFVRTSAKNILNSNNEVIYIDGTIEDRTDRMKAARALLESREMYRSLVEKANVGIVTDGLKSEITYYNSKFADLFGYTNDEMSKLTYDDLFHKDDIDNMREHHLSRVTGQNAPDRYVLRGIKKDGSSIFLEIAVDQLLDDEFNIVGTRAFLWDVTERRQTQLVQKALYEISSATSRSQNLNELYYEIKDILGTVIDTTNIFVALYNEEKDELSLPFEVDEKDKYDTFPAGKSMTAYVIKKSSPMLFREKDMHDLELKNEIERIGTPAKIWLGAPLKTTKSTIGLISVQSYDNPNLYTERDLEILAFVSNEIAIAIEKKRSEDILRETHSQLVGMHKELEKKVEKAVAELREKDHIIISQSRQAAIGDMISQIAHHWRQPLNIIGLNLQSIREAFEFDELTEEYMEEKTELTLEILDKLSKTIDDFRNYYQKEEVSNTFDVRDIIENTIYMIQSQFEQHDFKINKNLSDTAILAGSQNDFSQAFLNIITNSYEVLLKNNSNNPQMDICLNVMPDKVIIKVTDNGGGIADEMKDKLFDLYTSTKKELNNTGVGLYMSKNIIEKNFNGKLNAKNIGNGAVFTIELLR